MSDARIGRQRANCLPQQRELPFFDCQRAARWFSSLFQIRGLSDKDLPLRFAVYWRPASATSPKHGRKRLGPGAHW